MEKGRHLLIALTNPVPGKEHEYNEWYETTHVPQCLKVAGFKTGQRLKLTAWHHDAPRQQYLALYELEGDDPQAVIDELVATSAERTPSDAFDRSSVSLWVFSPIGKPQSAGEAIE